MTSLVTLDAVTRLPKYSGPFSRTLTFYYLLCNCARPQVSTLWLEALSSRGQTSEIWGPHATGEQPTEIQSSKIKSYPIESFSILTLMIFNLDSNCIFPGFQFRTLGSLRTCLGLFSRSLIFDDLWWISGGLM